MGYLVIKNGTNKKSYHTTTECDRPRLKAGAGYIPFTTADKSSFNLHVTAESSSSSGEYYTVTTGTSYLYSTYTTKVTYTYTDRYTTFTQNGTTGGSVVSVDTRETVINVTSSNTTGTSYLTDQQNNTASAKITVSNLAELYSYPYDLSSSTHTTGTTYLTEAINTITTTQNTGYEPKLTIITASTYTGSGTGGPGGYGSHSLSGSYYSYPSERRSSFTYGHQTLYTESRSTYETRSTYNNGASMYETRVTYFYTYVNTSDPSVSNMYRYSESGTKNTTIKSTTGTSYGTEIRISAKTSTSWG